MPELGGSAGGVGLGSCGQRKGFASFNKCKTDIAKTIRAISCFLCEACFFTKLFVYGAGCVPSLQGHTQRAAPLTLMVLLHHAPARSGPIQHSGMKTFPLA